MLQAQSPDKVRWIPSSLGASIADCPVRLSQKRSKLHVAAATKQPGRHIQELTTVSELQPPVRKIRTFKLFHVLHEEVTPNRVMKDSINTP